MLVDVLLAFAARRSTQKQQSAQNASQVFECASKCAKQACKSAKYASDTQKPRNNQSEHCSILQFRIDFCLSGDCRAHAQTGSPHLHFWRCLLHASFEFIFSAFKLCFSTEEVLLVETKRRKETPSERRVKSQLIQVEFAASKDICEKCCSSAELGRFAKCIECALRAGIDLRAGRARLRFAVRLRKPRAERRHKSNSRRKRSQIRQSFALIFGPQSKRKLQLENKATRNNKLAAHKSLPADKVALKGAKCETAPDKVAPTNRFCGVRFPEVELDLRPQFARDSTFATKRGSIAGFGR